MVHQISDKLSVVVPTLGRSWEIIQLLESLNRQSFKDFEIIIVDQNQDERVAEAIAFRTWNNPIFHLRTPNQKGLSRARNIGWRRARGQILVFPDDDCWYPSTLFMQVVNKFHSSVADVISGRIADDQGRSILGRFSKTSQYIDRSNVWTSGIEAMMFFKRNVLETVGGFDNEIGIGACTPWQSAEGQDILLRAIASGFKCYYDPAFYGHHPELNISDPDKKTQQKARAYGRGMGFVLRKHKYGYLSLAKWIFRPAAGAFIYALRGKWSRVLYYFNVATGRLEGWRQGV